jgi:hypothetical protein
MVPGRRFVITLAVVAMLVACSSYGEDSNSAPDGSAPTRDGGGGTSETGSPPTDGAVPMDAADEERQVADASPPSYGVACPSCPAGSTCFASGCDGAAKTSTCGSPIEITMDTSFVAFVCPDGPTINLPQTCVPGATPGVKHILPIRLGNTPSNKWRVSVSAAASNSFLAGGSCTTINSCAGGTSGTDRSFAALTLVMIGTTNQITSCVQLNVSVIAD